MKKIFAKKNFNIKEQRYVIGDEITNVTYEQIVKLNEKGFITPLEYKDLIFIKRELENKNNAKEELL